MSKLTGNIRYRLQERFLQTPIIVLQVEETIKCSGYDHTDLQMSRNPYEVSQFRDATFEDLQELNFITKE